MNDYQVKIGRHLSFGLILNEVVSRLRKRYLISTDRAFEFEIELHGTPQINTCRSQLSINSSNLNRTHGEPGLTGPVKTFEVCFPLDIIYLPNAMI